MHYMYNFAQQDVFLKIAFCIPLPYIEKYFLCFNKLTVIIRKPYKQNEVLKYTSTPSNNKVNAFSITLKHL